MKKQIITASVAALAFVTSTASAQNFEASAAADTETGVDTDADGTADADADAPAPEPEPVREEPLIEPEAPQSKIETEGGSDHEKVVGHFGVGYMGRQSMVVGQARTPVYAPIIGVRYWFDDFIGLDAGIGLNASSGKSTTNADGADGVRRPGLYVTMLHVGVPLNLLSRGSFSFQVVPEANMGFAGTGDQNPADDIKVNDTGFHLSAGARAGAEIQFGFIGLHELSLQGHVGLYIQHEAGATRTKADGADAVRVGERTRTFGSTLGPDPWDLFTGSIAALYYF